MDDNTNNDEHVSVSDSDNVDPISERSKKNRSHKSCITLSTRRKKERIWEIRRLPSIKSGEQENVFIALLSSNQSFFLMFPDHNRVLLILFSLDNNRQINCCFDIFKLKK